jgi:Ca2+-binding RTX toxin-like protein
LGAAYDTTPWFATPFDLNWNSSTPVTLTGDAKIDFLVGNAGNDMLVAGTGNDVFYGNSGSNTFAFSPGSGQEKIMDFQTDQDVIQFDPALFANYAAVMQDTQQVGANTVIQYDANTSVTLANTLASNLTANNIHFS